jgi:hypothetical protein
VSGATRYELQLDTANPPAITVAGTLASSYVPPGSLLPTTYYWRVRASDAAGNLSPWSVTRSVLIESSLTSAPLLYRYDTATPTLTWGSITWATGYQVQVDNNSTFSSPEYTNNTIPPETLQATTSPLAEGTWYWRVRARKLDGTWGIWSPAIMIVIDIP